MNPHYFRRDSRRYALNDYGSNTYPTTSIVQFGTAIGNSVASTTFASNVTQGNLGVVAFGYFNTANVPTVTDTLGTVYVPTGGGANPSGTRSALYIARFPSSGRCGITASVAVGGFANLVIAELKQPFGALVNASTANGAAGTPTCSVTGSGIVLAAIEGFHNGTTFTVNFPFTMITQVNGSDALGLAWYQSPSIQNNIASFGGASVDTWLINMCAIVY